MARQKHYWNGMRLDVTEIAELEKCSIASAHKWVQKGYTSKPPFKSYTRKKKQYLWDGEWMTRQQIQSTEFVALSTVNVWIRKGYTSRPRGKMYRWRGQLRSAHEIMELEGVCRNTVDTWLKQKLEQRPIRQHKVSFDGKMTTYKQIASKYGVSHSTAWKWVKCGYTTRPLYRNTRKKARKLVRLWSSNEQLLNAIDKRNQESK